MNRPRKSKVMYATEAHLDETREELKSHITSVKLDLESKIDQLSAKIGAMAAQVEATNAGIHRCLAIYEQQENRNKYVLDGYQSLYDRQDRVESEIIALKKHKS